MGLYKQPKRRAGFSRQQQRAMRLVWEPSGDFAEGMMFSFQEMSLGLRHYNFADGTVFMQGHRRLVVRGGFLHDVHGQVVLAMKSLGR